MVRQKQFHVLVATDGSAAARAAVTTAGRFPWPDGATASVIVARPPATGGRRSVLLHALDRTADAVAEGAARALRARWEEVERRVVDALPADAIVDEAGRTGARVVVMGWRGHGAVRRLITGSVSRGVARGAACSVLVVRRAPRDVRRVVIGFDGSPHAMRAVELMATLAPPRGARATLFMAVDPMHMPLQGRVPAATRAAVAAEVRRIGRQRHAAARRDLARAAKTLTAAGWGVATVLTDGAPLHDLLAVVARTSADLLVVGVRGVTGVRHLLLGSVAEGALNRSPVPVLLVR